MVTYSKATVREHRRAAVLALARAAFEIDALREASAAARIQDEEVDAVLEGIEKRLYEEGRVLGAFVADDVSEGLDDEEAAPKRPRRRRAGARGLGAALAALLFLYDHERSGSTP